MAHQRSNLNRMTREKVRQRGTVYLLVLGLVAMLIVLGVGGILLARSVADRNGLHEDQERAALLAQSYLEVLHTRHSGTTAWRSGHAHDTWSNPSEPLGAGWVKYKFKDELDGSLNDDATEPVRLYARAQVGGAVRVYSIELTCYDGLALVPDQATLRRESDQ